MADDPKSRPRSRLGRGLSSLINSSASVAVAEPDSAEGQYRGIEGDRPPARVPMAATPAANGKPLEVPVGRIAPNPHQPRKSFSLTELNELTQSVLQQGILQPLVVSPAGPQAEGRYVLVAGERRLRAAVAAGLATVPCVVRHASSQQLLEWALIENLRREDLNPLERARAYRDYVDRFSLSQAQAGERLGEPRTTIANHLRMLELPAAVQDLVASGSLSFGHAKVLAGLDLPAERVQALAERVVNEGLSVRQLEGLAGEAGGGDNKQQSGGQAKQGRSKPPYLKDLEDRLSHAVGTRVAIVPGRAKNTGRIVVDFYSLEDFDRISASLGLAEGE